MDYMPESTYHMDTFLPQRQITNLIPPLKILTNLKRHILNNPVGDLGEGGCTPHRTETMRSLGRDSCTR
jgi:hypothetical protein